MNDQNGEIPEHASIAALSGGGFVVTWDAQDRGPNYPYDDVYGRIFTEAGRPVGGQFTIPLRLVDEQDRPSVLGLSGDRFVAVYESDGADGDGEGIAGRNPRSGAGSGRDAPRRTEREPPDGRGRSPTC